MNARLRLPALIGALAVLAMGCAKEANQPAFSGNSAKGNPVSEAEEAASASGAAPDPLPLSNAEQSELLAMLDENPGSCNPIAGRNCLLPFPDDTYTVADASTGTGVRVDIPEGQLASVAGGPVDVTAWNMNDGFSPNTPIIAHVPGLDAAATNLPPENDIAVSTSSKSATVILDLDSGQLVPHWAELDQRAESPDDTALILRPAISLPETHTFAVAFRDLKGAGGQPLAAPIGYRVVRDNNVTSELRLADRQTRMQPVYTALATAGVNRADTYLAWTFTVASADSLAGAVLSMRDDAFGRLNGGAPKFAVTGERTTDLRPGIAKVVSGTFEVPLYLTNGGGPGTRLNLSPETGRPVADGTFTANFVCSVPADGIKNGESSPVVYGHGLLGSANEAASSQVQETAAQINALYCATNTIGMSSEDVGYAAEALSDISNFPAVPDRLQQGMINTLYLGRLMIHLDGLGNAPQFQTTSGANMIDTEEAYYDGNSQGAIVGGAVTAIATDWTKASFGVGGMNYSTLLNRSVDFDEYATILRGAYPNPLDQQLVFGLLQMLWDRGETGGYVQHLTDRVYDRTPPKIVLMNVAFGDHQVATSTAENIARTLKIPVYQPEVSAAVAKELGSGAFYNLSPIRAFPHLGSALFFWNSGTLAPPLGNITPIMGDAFAAACPNGSDRDATKDTKCLDPHEDPRRQPEVIAQKKSFFAPTGEIINVCKDEPCVAEPRSSFDY